MTFFKNLTYTVLAMQDASNLQGEETTLFSLNFFWLGQCLPRYVQSDKHWHGLSPGMIQPTEVTSAGDQWLQEIKVIGWPTCFHCYAPDVWHFYAANKELEAHKV